MKRYDYVIVGAGICGCMVAYELSKHTPSVLLIDSYADVARGASGAAGAFLSPLLGKPNPFKDLVTQALQYSVDFYQTHFPNIINQCGTVRIPKNDEDREKFQSYLPYIDFEYTPKEEGYYFPIGSVVQTYQLCKELTQNTTTQFNTTIQSIRRIDNGWLLDDKIEAKNVILTTGFCTDLIGEEYFNIRPVWGQRIDVETSTCISVNYHKECSLSVTTKLDKNTYKASIGATHHRFVKDKEMDNSDTQILLQRANGIKKLNDIEVIATFGGARASSVDYFPMVGNIINAAKTLEEFPYLINGTHVQSDRLSRYENLFVINGVGGRGFVLAPHLAKLLVDFMVNDSALPDTLTVDRLFNRWVKRQKG
jgi:tRNA 5-methylaminomethyl-2-thiouridine biosynthesis bifunctional protein